MVMDNSCLEIIIASLAWKVCSDRVTYWNVLVFFLPVSLQFDLPKHIHAVAAKDLDQLATDLNFSGWYQTSVKDNVNLQVALE